MAKLTTEQKLDRAERLAKEVMDWAKAHYDSKRYAWHMVAESITLFEMSQTILSEGITRTEVAISHFRATARIWAEQEREVRATAW